ncbi:hypothetical protein R6Z07F_005922 [Ovis aries]
MELCALRRVRWKAASPEAAHKGQIELCLPASAAARVLGQNATRYTPPEAGSRRPASQGHPEAGSKANQNDSRDSPASRRDLTGEKDQRQRAKTGRISKVGYVGPSRFEVLCGRIRKVNLETN